MKVKADQRFWTKRRVGKSWTETLERDGEEEGKERDKTEGNGRGIK